MLKLRTETKDEREPDFQTKKGEKIRRKLTFLTSHTLKKKQGAKKSHIY